MRCDICLFQIKGGLQELHIDISNSNKKYSFISFRKEYNLVVFEG